MISAYPKAALLAVHLFASVCLVIAGGSACSAGDVKAGRTKALMCQACHGLDGLSKTPDAPKSDAMSVVAPSLSDTDIEDLAAYFSSIEINVVKLPGG